VRTLQERLKITEVEKNPGKKRADIARRLGLAPSTLNSTFAKKEEIREQTEKCGNRSKERKTGSNSTYGELESVFFSWYKQTRATNIPVDGNVLREKAEKIAAQPNVENSTAFNGWITRFKDRHGLVYKKLAGESAAADSESTEVWLERLPSLLEGYEPRDIYNADDSVAASVPWWSTDHRLHTPECRNALHSCTSV
jgi:AcrR family transcriptional regulator